MSDRVTAVLILIFAALYGLEAFRLKSNFGSDSLGPRGFPVILAILIAITGVFLFFKTEHIARWPGRNEWVNLLSTVISFIIYAYLLVPLGFIAATTLETSFLSQRFGAKIWQAVVLGIGSSLFLYVLFVYALQIPLPIGKIFIQ